eukprot:7306077-Karenia_brevis.AAC.1
MQFIVDPAEVDPDELPGTFNPERTWLVGPGCPWRFLPKLPEKIILEVSDERKLNFPEVSGKGKLASPALAGGQAASATPRMKSGSPAVKSPPSPSTRKLRRTPSEIEELAAERIAKSTKAAFEKGKFHVQDRKHIHTVEFWLTEFLRHLKELRAAAKDLSMQAFIAGLNPWTAGYCDFVVDEILARPCWGSLGPVGGILKDIGTDFPDLLSADGRGIVACHGD